MKKHTISLYPLGKEIRVNDQTPLIDVLHEFGIEFLCGGNGTCGKCKVRLLDGEIFINPAHIHKLDKLGFTKDWRFCFRNWLCQACSSCTFLANCLKTKIWAK